VGATWQDGTTKPAELKAIAEASGCKLGYVDLLARRWHIPETKNQRDHTIHLSSFAVEQFEKLLALRTLDDDGRSVPWVFPNSKLSGPVDVKALGKQFADRQRSAHRRIKGRSKSHGALVLQGGHWTAHDLRRTCATMMAELGISGDVIDECLNHLIESRVRRIYIRDRRERDQTRAFDLLGARLEELSGAMPGTHTGGIPSPHDKSATRGHGAGKDVVGSRD
jgi:integrase